MTRYRIVAAAVAGSVVLLASGCMGGGDDGASGDAAPPAATAPATVATPVAVAPATLGGAVHAGPDTPADLVAALKGDDVIVVAFLNAKAADDQKVAKAVRDAQSDRVVSDGTRFFVYTLGRKRFGDLADLLGVEGTPSVAVIGRDRNLANLFTGLVDGDILRQAIWDAADTPAKNPGASTKAGKAAKADEGPSGNAEGIALAKQVNATYVGVPGVSLTFKGAKFNATGDVALTGGKQTAATFDATVGGQKLQLIDVDGTTYGRPEGQTCWKVKPDDEPDDAEPAVDLAGQRFSAPVTRGGVTYLRSVGPDANGVTMPRTYKIDPTTHRIASVTDRDGTATFTVLDEAPAIEVPSPLCGGTVS